MLQRIQTLFLLSATLLLSLLFFSKMAYSTSEIVKYTDIRPFLILSIITTALSFFSIFLYRKRMIQIRLSVVNLVLLVCYQGWIVYYFVTAPKGTAFSVTALFPAVAAFLVFLAIKFIARDEAMVRSVSRLRK